MWLFRLLFRRLMRLLRVGACGQASRRRRRRRDARFSPHGKGPAAKQGRCQVRLQGGGEPRIWQPPAARAAVPSPTREFPTCLLARAPRAGRAVMQKITPYRPRSWRHSHPLLPCKSPRGVRKRESSRCSTLSASRLAARCDNLERAQGVPTARPSLDWASVGACTHACTHVSTPPQCAQTLARFCSKSMQCGEETWVRDFSFWAPPCQTRGSWHNAAQHSATANRNAKRARP